MVCLVSVLRTSGAASDERRYVMKDDLSSFGGGATLPGLYFLNAFFTTVVHWPDTMQREVSLVGWNRYCWLDAENSQVRCCLTYRSMYGAMSLLTVVRVGP